MAYVLQNIDSSTPGGSAQLSRTCQDASGIMYVAGPATPEVRVIDMSGSLGLVSSDNSTGWGTKSCVFDGTYVHFAFSSGDRITAYHPYSGVSSLESVAIGTTTIGPIYDMAWDGSYIIAASDYDSPNNIQAISFNGSGYGVNTLGNIGGSTDNNSVFCQGGKIFLGNSNSTTGLYMVRHSGGAFVEEDHMTATEYIGNIEDTCGDGTYIYSIDTDGHLNAHLPVGTTLSGVGYIDTQMSNGRCGIETDGTYIYVCGLGYSVPCMLKAYYFNGNEFEFVSSITHSTGGTAYYSMIEIWQNEIVTLKHNITIAAYKDQMSLRAQIAADPIVGHSPLTVNFTSV